MMRHTRFFSLDDANQAVTQVAPRLARLKDLQASAMPVQARLDVLWRRLDAGERVLDEISDLQGRLDAHAREAAEILAQLEGIGCVVRDVQMGLVDFPARAGEAEFYLCWHLGEDAVRYWHGTHEGFAGRKPLTTMPGRVVH